MHVKTKIKQSENPHYFLEEILDQLTQNSTLVQYVDSSFG